ncbi:MAG: outer membrane lipoprotein-sorting protein [Bacteroidetes bacterium]|nr:MAG: outer membrane lipoprotein-sorting protein [Bacteroidota bacterium]
MKALNFTVLGLVLCFVVTLEAQSVEEIIENYVENIGGQEAWSKITSMKVTGVGKQQGIDYPFIASYMKDGRTIIDVNLQGNSFIVEAFDGENAWSMNFQTQKAEALDSESSINYKNEAKDNLTDAFFNYKAKGYSVELLGKEEWEGTECYKIKLTKTPVLVDGKEEENIDMYFFDTENYVPIAIESVIMSGPAKGATSQTLISDYQEVNGLYVAFSRIEKFNGQVSLELVFNVVEFNVALDESIFKMPVEETEPKKN